MKQDEKQDVNDGEADGGGGGVEVGAELVQAGEQERDDDPEQQEQPQKARPDAVEDAAALLQSVAAAGLVFGIEADDPRQEGELEEADEAGQDQEQAPHHDAAEGAELLADEVGGVGADEAEGRAVGRGRREGLRAVGHVADVETGLVGRPVPPGQHHEGGDDGRKQRAQEGERGERPDACLDARVPHHRRVGRPQDPLIEDLRRHEPHQQGDADAFQSEEVSRFERHREDSRGSRIPLSMRSASGSLEVRILARAPVAKLVDAQDLKSWDSFTGSCRFDSGPGHQPHTYQGFAGF